MAQSRLGPRRRSIVAALACSAMLVAGIGVRPASADVAAVRGSAFGYFTNVSLFGGPYSTRGPDPSVTLPSTGSVVPIVGAAPTGLAQYGPAVIFESGPLAVKTQGTTGLNGSVTSSASVVGLPNGPSPILHQFMNSTCRATEAGNTGSTTVVARVVLDDPDDTTVGEPGENIVVVPHNPPVNTEYYGTIANVHDNFRIVFNEQTTNPDGSLTVNAAHMYLLGPVALGDLIIGQSVCGVA